MSVRCLIVDDSPTMRALLTGLLRRDADIDVVGTAHDAPMAREMIRKLNPDVITLDIEMPQMNGLDFLQKLMRLLRTKRKLIQHPPGCAAGRFSVGHPHSGTALYGSFVEVGLGGGHCVNAGSLRAAS